MRVTAMVHNRQPEGLAGAKLVSGSLADRDGLAKILLQGGPFDAIVNCAGLASDVAWRSRLMEANCYAVQNIVACMGREPLSRLVHISTTDVYGIHDFADADEDTPLDDRTRDGYPKSKILAEQAIIATLPARRRVILRPGVVCGPGDQTILPRVLGFLKSSPRIIHFGRWRGANRWPLAHVKNLATAAFLAATCDDALGKAYNVVDPQRTTVEEYYRRIIAAFLPDKAVMKSITIPMSLAWPMAAVNTLLAKILRRNHPLMDPSLYALKSIASNLDISSRKLQSLFARHSETFVDSFSA